LVVTEGIGDKIAILKHIIIPSIEGDGLLLLEVFLDGEVVSYAVKEGRGLINVIFVENSDKIVGFFGKAGTGDDARDFGERKNLRKVH